MGGSAAPARSLEEVRALSSNPKTTTTNLTFGNMKLGLGIKHGDSELRERVTTLYDQSRVQLTPDEVVISNATTGSNLLVQEGLVSHNDHVVCVYPVYGPLFEVVKALGAEMSYWRLEVDNGWKANLEDLKTLLKPSTKMLILNNPHNPTGSILSTSTQAEIVQIAKQHNIIIFTDEIFRPLFHADEKPTSMLEHSATYDRIIVTGSLSKPWGLSGVRIGWVVTKNAELRRACLDIREYTTSYVSAIDEVVAREVLSERCKDQIIYQTLAIAGENLALLKPFVRKHAQQISCAIPTGGGTAFVRFKSAKSGRPIDDLQFCQRLKEETGVLLSPGSLCFGPVKEGDFRGFTRLHVTAPPETFKAGLEGIAKFLTSDSYTQLDG